MTDLQLLKNYQEAGLYGNKTVQVRYQGELFNRHKKMYFSIAREIWKTCKIKSIIHCVGRFDTQSLRPGYLYAGILNGHNIAMNKYHPMPGNLAKADFEERILRKTTENDTCYLKNLYKFDTTSRDYRLKDNTNDSLLPRWDIASRAGFMVTKFSTFAYLVCHRAAMNYCIRECMFFIEYKKQIQFLAQGIYDTILSSNTLSDQDIALVRNLYCFNKKKAIYTVKPDIARRQVLSLYAILYPTLHNEVPGVYIPKDTLLLAEVIGLIIDCIKQLPFIDQNILLFYMNYVPQKKIARLLKLSEVNITRKKRRIEYLLTSKVKDFYINDAKNNCLISLENLREIEYFRSKYFSYIETKGTLKFV